MHAPVRNLGYAPMRTAQFAERGPLIEAELPRRRRVDTAGNDPKRSFRSFLSYFRELPSKEGEQIASTGAGGYAEEAEAPVKQYESIPFADLHRQVLHLTPTAVGGILLLRATDMIECWLRRPLAGTRHQ